MRSSVFSVLLALAGCHSAVRPSPEPVVNPVAAALAPGLILDANDPATCAPCHAAVVAEFKESLHTRAHHASDPLYAALRTRRTEKQGAHIPAQCANCHNTRDPVDHESAAAKSGVTCATCHQLASVSLDGGNGLHALGVGPEKLFRGPHDVAPGTNPLHATGAALPALVDGTTLCLACHAEEHNPAGLATCNTGPEHAAGGGQPSCTSCHMKSVEGPSGAVTSRTTHRDHRFAGPHHQFRTGGSGLLDEAVGVSAQFDGASLNVTLENRSAHAFPTGFPARVAMLEVRGLDANGKEVFRNITSDPMKEHPQAVFNRGFVDAEGKPSLAPFAVKQVRDNRLQPKEQRVIAVAVPPTLVSAEVRLKFFLLAPFAAQQLGYQGPETKPIVLPAITAKR